MKIPVAIDDFINYCIFEKGLSSKTAESYRNDLMIYEEFLKEQNILDTEFYHYDTPLTIDHEKEALFAAGFSSVEVLNNWGATYTLKALR